MIDKIKSRATNVIKPNLTTEIGKDLEGRKLLLVKVGAGEEVITIPTKDLEEIIKDYERDYIIEYNVEDDLRNLQSIIVQMIRNLLGGSNNTVSIVTSDHIRNLFLQENNEASLVFKNYGVVSIPCLSKVLNTQMRKYNNLSTENLTAYVFVNGQMTFKFTPKI